MPVQTGPFTLAPGLQTQLASPQQQTAQTVVIDNLSGYLLSISVNGALTWMPPYTENVFALGSSHQPILVVPQVSGVAPAGSIAQTLVATWYSAGEALPSASVWPMSLTAQAITAAIAGEVSVSGSLDVLVSDVACDFTVGSSFVANVADLAKSYSTIVAVWVSASGTLGPAFAVAVDGANGPRFTGSFHASTLVGITGQQALMGFANNVGDTLNLTLVGRATCTGALYVFGVSGVALAPLRGDGRTRAAGELSVQAIGTSGSALAALAWGRYLVKHVVIHTTSAGDSGTLTATIGGNAVAIASGTVTSPANVGFGDGLLCDTDTALTVVGVTAPTFTIVYDIVA